MDKGNGVSDYYDGSRLLWGVSDALGISVDKVSAVFFYKIFSETVYAFKTPIFFFKSQPE